ncbi:MAG: folate-binding protein YgfZ [Acidobacteriota bacterium]|nr:MAG: folate-binding protein YgfZ [Acidobacteriota bacterium]
MTISWASLLGESGARFDGGRLVDFGDLHAEASAAAGENVVADLSHFGLIIAGGPQAGEFLQGQFTNDLHTLSADRHGLGAYCSPKGRVLATFRVFRRQAAWHIRLPIELTGPVLERLQLYKMRAQVELGSASDDLLRLGASGPTIAQLLEHELGPVPSEDGAAADGELSVLRVSGEHPRFEIYGALDAVSQLWSRLVRQARPVGPRAWALTDIRAGVPNIYRQTAESFIPQMLGLETLGAVSFTKGCYPGQEVVARTQHLGAVKRRLFSARARSARELPDPATPLRAKLEDAIREAGTIIEAAWSPRGGVDLLAVMSLAVVESETVAHLEAGDAVPLDAIRPAVQSASG